MLRKEKNAWKRIYMVHKGKNASEQKICLTWDLIQAHAAK
jgi:hypothetical protein